MKVGSLAPGTMVLLAGGLWAVAGTVLSVVGVLLLWGSGGLLPWLLLVLALVLGGVKGRLIMCRVADRNVARLHGLCVSGTLWRIYTPGGWAFIAAMMLLGMALRRFNTALATSWGRPALGVVDLAVGVALLIGAHRYRRSPTGRLD
ncbi:MAG: hypothetical protein IID40_10085 [Planctomycetes bacterium]|nr:hypothetical protein [Planctomycetota bacterium]